jgi:heat shock protein HtpX
MLPVFGLYTHIRANRFRSIAQIGALFAMVYVAAFAGFLLAEGVTIDAPASTIIAQAWRHFVLATPAITLGLVLWCLFAFRFNQAIVRVATGGRDPSPEERRRIAPMVEELCISRGLATPRLGVLETPALNAFATGTTQAQYAITVTTGLLENLDDREIRAVLGHELTHIRNEDVRLMTIAVVVAGVVAFFAELVFRMFSNFSWSSSSGSSSSSSSSKKDSGGGLVVVLALALLAIAWVMSLAIRLGLSRSREYLADAGSVELTKDPDAMIAALRKIDTKGEIENVPSGVMEMCLDNPRSGFADLFSTHPSIESRIAALEQYAGGRDMAAPAQAEPAVSAPPQPQQGVPANPWGASSEDAPPKAIG